MTEHKVIYIQNNQDNDLTPSDSQLYRCALILYSAGDKFTINATGKTAGRPLAFVDNNGRIVDGKAAEYSSSDVVVSGHYVHAGGVPEAACQNGALGMYGYYNVSTYRAYASCKGSEAM